MKRIIRIMSGIPGAGKSTIAKRTQKDNEIYLSRDEFRNRLREELNSEAYFPVSHNKEYDLWIDHINEVLKFSDCDVCIDQSTINYASLNKLLTYLDIDYDLFDVEVWRINVSLEDCLKRNAAREGFARCPDSVIKRFYDLSKLPLFTTPNDKIKVIEIEN